MSSRTPASLSSSVYLTSEMVKTNQDCGWEAREGELKNIFLSQPRNNKLEIMRLDFLFFSVLTIFIVIQSGTKSRMGIDSDHVSCVLLQLGFFCLNPFMCVQSGCHRPVEECQVKGKEQYLHALSSLTAMTEKRALRLLPSQSNFSVKQLIVMIFSSVWTRPWRPSKAGISSLLKTALCWSFMLLLPLLKQLMTGFSIKRLHGCSQTRT